MSRKLALVFVCRSFVYVMSFDEMEVDVVVSRRVARGVVVVGGDGGDGGGGYGGSVGGRR